MTEPTKSEVILSDVQLKLKELEQIIQELPAGYRYKVRELGSCIETVVSMYDDVQRGVIPDVLREMREQSTVLSVPNAIVFDEPKEPIKASTTLDIGISSI